MELFLMVQGSLTHANGTQEYKGDVGETTARRMLFK